MWPIAGDVARAAREDGPQLLSARVQRGLNSSIGLPSATRLTPSSASHLVNLPSSLTSCSDIFYLCNLLLLLGLLLEPLRLLLRQLTATPSTIPMTPSRTLPTTPSTTILTTSSTIPSTQLARTLCTTAPWFPPSCILLVPSTTCPRTSPSIL